MSTIPGVVSANFEEIDTQFPQKKHGLVPAAPLEPHTDFKAASSPTTLETRSLIKLAPAPKSKAKPAFAAGTRSSKRLRTSNLKQFDRPPATLPTTLERKTAKGNQYCSKNRRSRPNSSNKR